MANPNCDICGLEVKDGDLRYTSADKLDEESRWISARHSSCQVSRVDNLKEDAKRLSKDVEDMVAKVRKMGL